MQGGQNAAGRSGRSEDPNAEHPQPRGAEKPRARSGAGRALRARAARPRARSRSPARRSGSGSRARALGASLVRLLHSLRAEWSVGSSCGTGWEGRRRGGEGRRRPGPEEGPQPAAGESGEPGWGKARVGARSPCASPLASLPATGHCSQSAAPCLGVLEPRRPRGFFSCCTHHTPPLTPRTQNPEPKRGKESLLPPLPLPVPIPLPGFCVRSPNSKPYSTLPVRRWGPHEVL